MDETANVNLMERELRAQNPLPHYFRERATSYGRDTLVLMDREHDTGAIRLYARCAARCAGRVLEAETARVDGEVAR